MLCECHELTNHLFAPTHSSTEKPAPVSDRWSLIFLLRRAHQTHSPVDDKRKNHFRREEFLIQPSARILSKCFRLLSGRLLLACSHHRYLRLFRSGKHKINIDQIKNRKYDTEG